MTVCLLKKEENKTTDLLVCVPFWNIMVVLGQLNLENKNVILHDRSVLFT